ncbi:LysM peptidoglycan-binding domain-containing protein [Paenibacillus sp. S150]|uniref:LysM peptidoglycan-binding domain-containing protein n=1 Tax=Paenibacillus sp. S150 TaxID=2749826 RepID=UPI001C57FACE|nr:LysM peptidoglycan-binding domain-containing protein [Paenibacillus sp. S150]MBW4084732.1 LysM peptidoglycan-binding domain-containing protein [Paenibacillus sp. S150]
MFDQSHGLRFDIYERIHLPAELPGIAELEEVELIPDIQVIQREDRAELYGQLLLTGLYRGEDDRTQRLEHAIPVEITVPLTRVSSLEDIGVEIENFDIDLLTMRTVNITGVLSLRGIGSGETQPAWQQEEYTVAYSAEEEERSQEAQADKREHENDALYENSLWTYGEGATDVAAPEHEHANAVPAENSASAVNPLFLDGAVYAQPAAFAEPQAKDKESKVRTHSLDAQSSSAAQPTDHWQKADKAVQEPVASHFFTANALNTAETAQVSGSTDAPDTKAGQPDAEIHAAYQEEPASYAQPVEKAEALPNEAAAESVQENVSENENLVPPDVQPLSEEKPDLKIALGSKQEEKPEAQEHLTFSSLLSSSRARKEQENQQEQEPESLEAAPDSGNDTEWKSRFIGGLGGTELFRKVRLCIVQREETLDTIAEKYQLSARELVMYNRLSGQNVEEGQVLYIP